jgi:hypothetical protein
MQRRRRASGSKPQEESLAKLKPWQVEGISRATWFRRQAKAHETGVRQKQNGHETNSFAMNLTNNLAQTSLTENVERLKERKGLSRNELVMKERTSKKDSLKKRTNANEQNELVDKLLSSPCASSTNQSREPENGATNGASARSEDLALKKIASAVFCRVTVREIRHPAIKSGPTDDLDDFAAL